MKQPALSGESVLDRDVDHRALKRPGRTGEDVRAASMLAIGEVGRRSGLAPSAIRYYEAAGLLEAPVRISGKRRYPAGVLDQLAVIEAARQAGFRIAEIREFMIGVRAGARASEEWKTLARRKLPEVEAILQQTQAVRDLLVASLECACGADQECELFSPEQAAVLCADPMSRS